MIIKRKYEWLGWLYENDPLSKSLIDQLFTCFDKETKNSIIICHRQSITAFLDMGCGIPGKVYQKLLEGFDILDKCSPYDNGLTFRDVTNVVPDASRKGTAIQLTFLSEFAECRPRIVCFAAISNDDSGMKIIDGWTPQAVAQ